MDAIILTDHLAQVQSGQRRVITSTGRTTNFEELDATGRVVAEGGVCTDKECDCAGEWWHWQETK